MATFDLEVFKVDQGGEIQALSFINDQSSNAQDLRDQIDPTVLSNTIQGSNQQILNNFPVLDDTYVEYYFVSSFSIKRSLVLICHPTLRSIREI